MGEVWYRFKCDAARWVNPEQIGDPDSLRPLQILNLLRLHRPLRAIGWFRLGTWAEQRNIRGVSVLFEHRLQSKFGLDMAMSTDVGPGFYIAHPTGAHVGAARIGSNLTLVGGLTLGINGSNVKPTIGDDVFIGAGARVLGDITIGNGVTVGANSVVLNDVADNLTMVGAPAKPTQKSLDAAAAAQALSA